ncbi:hypothetical protein [Thermophilibacter sp.]
MRSAPAARALRALAIVCRVAAWALVALVVADAVTPAGPRAWLLGVNSLVSSLLPDAVSGLLVIVTPFGGAFRGDFAIVAIVLLVLDWALCRLSASLR